jgi:hypothetical protein
VIVVAGVDLDFGDVELDAVEAVVAGRVRLVRTVEERPACVRELLADLVAGAETGLLVPFARNLASWRSTAEAWSDPRLARELQGPFDGDGPVIDRPVQDVA